MSALDAARRRASGAGRPFAARGYTLLELLLVLAIAALAGLVVAPSLAGWGRDADRRALRREVIALVRGAQVEATARGAPIEVAFDPGRRELVAGRTGRLALPAGWRVEIAGVRAGGDGADADAEGAPPASLMVWSPGGLASQSKWRAVDARGRSIEVVSDAIEGATIR